MPSFLLFSKAPIQKALENIRLDQMVPEEKFRPGGKHFKLHTKYLIPSAVRRNPFSCSECLEHPPCSCLCACLWERVAPFSHLHHGRFPLLLGNSTPLPIDAAPGFSLLLTFSNVNSIYLFKINDWGTPAGWFAVAVACQLLKVVQRGELSNPLPHLFTSRSCRLFPLKLLSSLLSLYSYFSRSNVNCQRSYNLVLSTEQERHS